MKKAIMLSFVLLVAFSLTTSMAHACSGKMSSSSSSVSESAE